MFNLMFSSQKTSVQLPGCCDQRVRILILLDYAHSDTLFPPWLHRFRPTKAREIIATALNSRLAGVTYNADKMSILSRDLADEIKQKLKGTTAQSASQCCNKVTCIVVAEHE